jgi:hypothetical protein
MGVSGQRHAPAALYPRERTLCSHWIGGWVGPRAGLDAEARRKILCLCRGSNPVRLVHSQTLYWRATPAYQASCKLQKEGKFYRKNGAKHGSNFRMNNWNVQLPSNPSHWSRSDMRTRASSLCLSLLPFSRSLFRFARAIKQLGLLIVRLPDQAFSSWKEVNSTGNPITNRAAIALRSTPSNTSDPYYKFEKINLQDELAQSNKWVSRHVKLTEWLVRVLLAEIFSPLPLISIWQYQVQHYCLSFELFNDELQRL